MKDFIAQEVVRHITSEVFKPKTTDSEKSDGWSLYEPRTDAEIAECATRAIRLSKQAVEGI